MLDTRLVDFAHKSHLTTALSCSQGAPLPMQITFTRLATRQHVIASYIAHADTEHGWKTHARLDAAERTSLLPHKKGVAYASTAMDETRGVGCSHRRRGDDDYRFCLVGLDPEQHGGADGNRACEGSRGCSL